MIAGGTRTGRHAPGDVVAGRWRLVSPIHVGGMAEVWRAAGVAEPRDVVVKFPREEVRADTVVWRRLLREGQNLAAVRSRHVAEFIAFGTDHLVMEYVDGASLATALAERHTLPAHEVAHLLAGCADGLADAHLAGVLHRDVKPSNIMLAGRGAVLTDFGVSWAVGQETLTDPGRVMGTAEHLAPELLSGAPASPASDVYALGICAWEALTGSVPFRGPNPVRTAFAHVEQPVPELPPHVPARLAELVRAMLSKDPLVRPTTARVGACARAVDHMRKTHNAPERADRLGGDARGELATDRPRPQRTEEDQW